MRNIEKKIQDRELFFWTNLNQKPPDGHKKGKYKEFDRKQFTARDRGHLQWLCTEGVLSAKIH